MSRLEGVRTLVTGGTSGIGEAVVERLRADGAEVVFTGRSEERGRAVAERTGGVFVEADVTDGDAVKRSVETAVEALGGLDAVVLNAGVLLEGSLAETTDEAWDSIMDVNVFGPYRYALACLPHLRAAGGGSIVALTSDAGVWVETSVGAYSVSKRALIVLAQMLGTEVGKDGIRVNLVCPGRHGSRHGHDGRGPRGARPGRLAPAARRAHRDGARHRSGRRVLRLARLVLLQRGRAARRRRHARRSPRDRRAERVTMYPELQGRVALVTGGNSGIGKACVERLSQEGMTVAFTGRNEERGEAVAAATGARFVRQPTTGIAAHPTQPSRRR